MKNSDLPIENIVALLPLPTALLDTNLGFIAVSKKWLAPFEITDDSPVIGKSYFQVFPENTDKFKDILTQCLKGNDNLEIDEIRENADGQTIYLRHSVKHFRNQEREIAGLIITTQDLTENEARQFTNYCGQFFEYFPGLCWIFGPDHRLAYANTSFYQTLHLTDDVIGKKKAEIFGHDIALATKIHDEQVLETDKGVEFQQTSRDRNGHLIVYKIYKFPFTDPKSKLKMVGSVALDITKSALLREDFDKSEAQFNLAFEHSLIGMAVITPDGHWKRVNTSLCQMLGYSEEEMKMHTVQELTHPDDRALSLSMLTDLNNGNTERTKFEKRYLHKNGSSVWVIIAATMLYDDDMKPLYYVSQIEDITQRKEIENDLMLSEKKYRTIFENVQDVFYQTDQNGIVIEISPSIEKYSGYSRDKIIGKPVSDFYFYPQDRARILESLRTNGVVIDFEVRLKTHDQELRYASVNARLITENGEVVAIEGSMRDVTARKFQENTLKALNSELTASNQQKNKLLSIIGHDLRNPISGSLQLLAMTIDDIESTSPDEIKTYLLAMKDELSNANTLLEDLLEWAKSQFNTISFNPVSIDNVQELIDKCLRTVSPMAEKKQIEITVDRPKSISLEADRAMLETVIRNLLTNAIKFTPLSGHIQLSVDKSEDGTKFSIKDNGVGIPKDKIALLFGNTSFTTFGTDGEKGTGLGLGLCYDFITRHHGQIWAESEIGKGSTFMFTIPVKYTKT